MKIGFGIFLTVCLVFSAWGQDLQNESEREWLSLTEQLKTGMLDYVKKEAFHPASTLWNSDRDPVDIVLRRLYPLVETLQKMPGGPKLAEETRQLTLLAKEVQTVPVEDVAKRKALFIQIGELRKKIAFQNPLLNFTDILFIKRNDCIGQETKGCHMCDQFFGFHQLPGGGVFVLKDAFTDCPQVVDVLRNAVLENGRNKGQKLDASWGFLSPELSYDTGEILFAAADTKSERHTSLWTQDNSFHLFKASFDPKNAEASRLTQLTDEAVDDFDPCYLPSGRIVFISERRGGYGRCHPRIVPTYTLHSMNTDGSDIQTISWHETNEWAPVVDANGMVIYTRWDYVDRGANNAHHPWMTTPDGRDPRALQGNYHVSKAPVPLFDADIQPIPHSHKLVATAMAHHGQSYGSLVLIDPQVPDDNLMSAVRRITPDQLFPETELEIYKDKPCNYGTAYPLSESFYLCVYDAFSKGNAAPNNHYGIYLLDAFGNRVLLYRDPKISCREAIPVRPRKKPMVVPHVVLRGKPLAEGETFTPVDQNTLPKTATMALVNVYDTQLPFPEGTKITRLRIVQILPKTKTHPYESDPWIGYGHQKNARRILGTVPVEADGSAYFTLPVNVPVYFQALDENGVAVQSMRSDTYVQEGENLVCQGCHENRHTAITARPRIPNAMRRSPSEIVPDPDGTNPFNYVRLIQPILDAKCVECHAKSDDPKAIDLSRGPEEKHFFNSFENLKPYCFFFNHYLWTEPQTIPGKFGANASPLYRILQSDHYGLKLTPEEKYRFVLWMDNNCDFYGSYDHCEAQKRGEVVQPELE